VVGELVENFSLEFRRPRGLFICPDDLPYIDSMLANRTHPDVKILVVTDGEGVLGMGDQGVGGMAIPIAKLMVYTLCGGIDPVLTLPIMLDAGTDNQTLLNDPFYVGWRQPRLKGAAYDAFVDGVISGIKRHFPDVFLHWEDLGRDNARRMLKRYEKDLVSFNDDMQGTGAVALAAVLAGCQVQNIPLTQQRIVVFGAGTAGVGIADQIYRGMCLQGLDAAQARKNFWLYDREGVLTTATPLLDFQIPYARDPEEFKTHPESLAALIEQVKPTLLIGCSTVRGAFTEEVVQTMHKHCPRPMIFPLSNPNEKCEAFPADLLRFTNGEALVAAGSPFAPVMAGGRKITVAQCNNALIYPGIGVGVLASKATTLDDEMLMAASLALAAQAPALQNPIKALLPKMTDAPEVNKRVAIAVAKVAKEKGHARADQNQTPEEWVEAMQWRPEYKRIVG